MHWVNLINNHQYLIYKIILFNKTNYLTQMLLNEVVNTDNKFSIYYVSTFKQNKHKNDAILYFDKNN